MVQIGQHQAPLSWTFVAPCEALVVAKAGKLGWAFKLIGNGTVMFELVVTTISFLFFPLLHPFPSSFPSSSLFYATCVTHKN
jgi:hypothetical protein